ncbi:unnamed protein product [Meloidogyne enterolobii]|uniref:Uncharacterized protein n=1 Tax=Meloidogyne enterolobii TaxID=390850 RepID=A0ACB0YE17_MELEN
MQKNSGDEAKEVNYIYANELSFLRQYLQERPSSSSSIRSTGGRPAASREEVDMIASECIPEDEEDDLIDIGGSEAGIRPLSNDSASSRTPKRRRRVSVDPVDEALLKALEEKPIEDSSMLYARSLAEFMRGLTRKKEIEFRLEIEKLKLNFIEE